MEENERPAPEHDASDSLLQFLLQRLTEGRFAALVRSRRLEAAGAGDDGDGAVSSEHDSECGDDDGAAAGHSERYSPVE